MRGEKRRCEGQRIGQREDLNAQKVPEKYGWIPSLLATPERRFQPSWVWLGGHIPDLEGTLDPGVSRLHRKGKPSRVCN